MSLIVESLEADALGQLPAWASDLLGEQRVARLGLIDDRGRPRVLPVTFVRWNRALWTIVDRKPKRPGGKLARIRWLRERPQAALTVDRYDDDWSALAWVQLLGVVALIDTSAQPEAVAALTRRYRQYELDPPPGPLLRLDVERALWWRAADAGSG